MDITVATVKEKDGYNLSNVHIGSQSGSHVDAPYHFKNDGLTVDRMELSYFMGNALVIDASDKGEFEEITLEDVKKYDRQMEKQILCCFGQTGIDMRGRINFSDTLTYRRRQEPICWIGNSDIGHRCHQSGQNRRN